MYTSAVPAGLSQHDLLQLLLLAEETGLMCGGLQLRPVESLAASALQQPGSGRPLAGAPVASTAALSILLKQCSNIASAANSTSTSHACVPAFYAIVCDDKFPDHSWAA